MFKISSLIDSSTSSTQIVVEHNKVDNGSSYNDDFDKKFTF